MEVFNPPGVCEPGGSHVRRPRAPALHLSNNLTTPQRHAKTLTNTFTVRPRGADASPPIRDENCKRRLGNHAFGNPTLAARVYRCWRLFSKFFWRNSIASRPEPGVEVNASEGGKCRKKTKLMLKIS